MVEVELAANILVGAGGLLTIRPTGDGGVEVTGVGKTGNSKTGIFTFTDVAFLSVLGKLIGGVGSGTISDGDVSLSSGRGEYQGAITQSVVPVGPVSVTGQVRAGLSGGLPTIAPELTEKVTLSNGLTLELRVTVNVTARLPDTGPPSASAPVTPGAGTLLARAIRQDASRLAHALAPVAGEDPNRLLLQLGVASVVANAVPAVTGLVRSSEAE